MHKLFYSLDICMDAYLHFYPQNTTKKNTTFVNSICDCDCDELQIRYKSLLQNKKYAYSCIKCFNIDVLLELRGPALAFLSTKCGKKNTTFVDGLCDRPQLVEACGQPLRIRGIGRSDLDELQHALGVGRDSSDGKLEIATDKYKAENNSDIIKKI